MFFERCLSITVVVLSRSGVPHFNISPFILSSPEALLLLKLLKLFLTSSVVILY